jgi:transposase
VRYSPEVRERAVRLVFEHQAEYPSQWSAMESIAPKIGCTAETLRKWVRQAERDQGLRESWATSDRERLKVLERENRESKRANEILRKASAFFAQAELGRRPKSCCRSSIRTGRHTGSSRSARSCRLPRPYYPSHRHGEARRP